MYQEIYPNEGKLITTGGARFLIENLFAGRGSVKRSSIIQDIREHHTNNGGKDSSKEKVETAVKTALHNLEEKGLAEKDPINFGYWIIHKTPSSVYEESPEQTAQGLLFSQNERELLEAELTDLASEAKELAARATALESKVEKIAARIRKT